MAKLDEQIAVLHESMAEAAADHVRAGELNAELQEMLTRKESLEEAWLSAAEAKSDCVRFRALSARNRTQIT